MLDLILPRECGGCGAPSTHWCGACAQEWAVGPGEPRVVSPRIDPQVAVFTLGRYAGARRRAIIAMKDHGRVDLIGPLARALAIGIHRLLAWGMVDIPLVLVPAPTRRWAAHRRGGDPITRIAAAAGAAHPGITVSPVLRMKATARDSVGLGMSARERNIAGRVVLRGHRPTRDVLLVDDVLTTGATARESVRVLRTAGVPVVGVLVIAAA